MVVHGLMLRVSRYRSILVDALLILCAEVAFVGKAVGSYVMLLGGGYYGQRLNKIYRGKNCLFVLKRGWCIHTFTRRCVGTGDSGDTTADDKKICTRAT